MKRPPVKIDPIPFTQDGFDKLLREQKELQEERPDVLEHLKKARAMGDLKENGYYSATKQKLNYIDGRLRRIAFLLKYGVIVTSENSGVVDIGATVKLNDGTQDVTYTIVGKEESNPSEGSISYKSPLGKMLLGKKKGDKVTVSVPKGDFTYSIKEITI